MPVPTCTDPPEPLVRRMDLASQLIAATMRGAKHEVFDMPTNGSDNAVPASLRCPRCAQPMRVVRRTPRFGGVPDLYTFECRSCGISHIEESGPGRWRDTDLFRLFSKQARECRRLATLAQGSEDRSFWIRLSEHWLKLAQGAGQRSSCAGSQCQRCARQGLSNSYTPRCCCR
jgi:hypothetical protein